MEVLHIQERFKDGYLQSLQPYPNWVVWSLLENKQGEMKKVPFNPRTHMSASTTNPQTWDRLPVALNALKSGRFAGLGFVFSESAPFTGIDFDNCLVDGKITPDVEDIVAQLDSYTEYSPSLRGLHVIVKGKLPGKNIKQKGIEMYDSERFFTITLNHLPGFPIDVKESSYLPALYERYTKRQPAPAVFSPFEAVQPRYSDEAVLRKAMSNPRMGELFRRHFMADASLWTGPQAIHNSPSEAVWRLVLYLRFYTYGNASQMDRLFRQSELYTISKWDEPRGSSTYGRETIMKALEPEEK